MTFTAYKTDRQQYGQDTVIVQVTSGPVTIQVEEPVDYVRSFWHDLGRLLGEVRHVEKAAEEIAESAGDGEPDS